MRSDSGPVAGYAGTRRLLSRRASRRGVALLAAAIYAVLSMVPQSVEAQHASARPYVSRSLAETIRLFNLDFRRRGEPLTGLILATPGDPGSNAKVLYTGECRKIDGLRRDFLDKYTYELGSEDTGFREMMEAYHYEIRVMEAGRAFWIPVQDIQLSCMPEELVVGDTVEISVRLRGGRFEHGVSDYFFTAHEFTSPRPDGVTYVTTRAQNYPPGRDPGVDLAVTSFAVSNLRAEPGYATETDAIRLLPEGATLSLIDRAPRGAFFHVIDAESGDEGWIHFAVIDRALTTEPREGSGFEAERTYTATAPTLTIENGTPKTLRLRLNGALYVLDPGASRELQLSAGPVSYYGWVAGALPDSGNERLENGFRYSWRFYIKTVQR